MILPMELIEKCVGSQIWVVNKQNVEFVGLLKAYDDYMRLVLEEVTEYERTPTGYNKTQIGSILLNSSQIALLVPGGLGPEAAAEPEEATA